MPTSWLRTVFARAGLIDDRAWRRAFLFWMTVLLVLDAVAALSTPGYFHPDEHYQTLEFANLKLGGNTVADLPWEYPAQIRPWLQPGLYYVWGSILRALGITDPFTWVTCFRVGSALIAWIGTGFLGLAIGVWLEDTFERELALAASATLAWTPFLHARTSSENLSGAFLLVAIAILALAAAPARGVPSGARIELSWRSAVGAGAAFGIAFLFRYQTALFAAGAWLWALAIARARVRWLATFLGATLVLVALGAVIDRWGYGEWVFVPWRYLRENLVAGKAASFGVRPLWAYVGLVWHDLPKPFSGLVILVPLVALALCPRHLLVWMSVPFLLVHSALAHKETRFLFPWLLFQPALAAIALSGRVRLWRKERAFALVMAPLVAWNTWLLFFGALPLDQGAWLEVAMEAAHRDGGPTLYEVGEWGPGEKRLVPRLYTGDATYDEARDREAIARLERGEVPFRYARLFLEQPVPEPIRAACAPLALDPPRLAWIPEAHRSTGWVLRLLNIRHPRVLWSCEGGARTASVSGASR